MTAITTAQTGNYSIGSTWTGGVVPIEGDTITIQAGHTVTIDQNVIVGADTSTPAITNYGVLEHDTTASRIITLKGNLELKDGSSWLIGSSESRVPVANTITYKFNYSSSMAHNKYGIITAYSSTSIIKMYGYSRTTNTTLTSQASASQAVINVADATGWTAGDTIVVDTSTSSYTQIESKTILSISGTQVTFTGNLSYTHASGSKVSNVTKNIILSCYNSSYQWGGYLRGSTNGNTVFDNVQLQDLGRLGGSITTTGLFLDAVTTPASTPVYATLTDCAVTNSMNSASLAFITASGQGAYLTATNIALFTSYAGKYGRGVNLLNSAKGSFTNINGYKMDSLFYEGGCASNSFTNINASGCSYGVYESNCANNTYNNLNVYASSYGVQMGLNIAAGNKYINCNFGTGAGGTQYNSGADITGNTSGSFVQDYFQNCNFNSTTFTTNVGSFLPGSWYQLDNCTVQSTANINRIYQAYGYYEKELSVFKNGTTSAKLITVTNGLMEQATTFLAKSGVNYTICGNIRYNSAYVSGTYNLPSITISGMGITPVTFIASADNADTWQPFTLNVTQTSGVDGLLTLTFSGQSNTPTGAVYFDGIPINPFITSVRHYGYIYDETIITRTVDPIIQLSEAEALALEGISIDWENELITITGTINHREMYDYCKAQLAQAANLAYPNFISSSDGTNYTLTFCITIDGGHLTGTGTENIGTCEITILNGGTSTVNIISTARTFTGITLNGLVSGSRVQLYNVDTDEELYNDIVNDATLFINAFWTENQNIRVRVSYVDGITAKKWYEVQGILYQSGMGIIIEQKDDDIYNEIGIDGSTVDECSIVGTNLVININDPDNSESMQRIYAFECYWLYTEEGIADQELYIDAQSYTYFMFEGGLKVKNLKSDPLYIIGGVIGVASGLASDIYDISGGPIFLWTDRVVVSNKTDIALSAINVDTTNIISKQDSMDQKINDIPTTPLLTDDSRLDKLTIIDKNVKNLPGILG